MAEKIYHEALPFEDRLAIYRDIQRISEELQDLGLLFTYDLNERTLVARRSETEIQSDQDIFRRVTELRKQLRLASQKMMVWTRDKSAGKIG